MILESGQKGLCGGHIDGGIRDRTCDRGTEVLRRVAGLVETDEYVEPTDDATHRTGVENVDCLPADVGVSALQFRWVSRESGDPMTASERPPNHALPNIARGPDYPDISIPTASLLRFDCEEMFLDAW